MLPKSITSMTEQDLWRTLKFMLKVKKKTQTSTRILRWLSRIIQTQLFVTLISLPVVTWWGIPVSLLTIVGNTLFTPALSCFLLLSSLLVVTELCHVPNMILVKLLDMLTESWLWILECAGKNWLVAFPQPPLWWCILVPIGAISCIKYAKTRMMSIVFLASLTVGSCTYLKIVYSPKKLRTEIPCGKGNVHLVRNSGITCLIDPGYTARMSDPTNWVDYTLMPTLIKTAGSMTIDHYLLIRPTVRTLKAVHYALNQMTIKHLYIPVWKKTTTTSKTLARTFMQLKTKCITEKICLHRLTSKPTTIALAQDTTITITAVQQKVHKNSSSITPLKATLIFDNIHYQL